MKPKKMTTKLFSLSCEQQPGLLPRILQTFARPGYVICSLSQCPTDLNEVMLVTLEVAIPGALMDAMVKKLERIIGVLEVTVSFGATLQTAIFRLNYQFVSIKVWDILLRHNARAISLDQDQLLVHQLATLPDIQRLYNELEGPALLGFSRLPLAISQPLSFEEVKDCSAALLKTQVQA